MNIFIKKSASFQWNYKKIPTFYLSIKAKERKYYTMKLVKQQINTLATSLSKSKDDTMLNKILNGELYNEQISKIFNDKSRNAFSDNNRCDIALKDDENAIKSLLFKSDGSEDDFDPYTVLEKSITTFEIDNTKLNIFKYFNSFSEFISSLNLIGNNEEKDYSQDNVNKFIDSLCKIYLANNLHFRIKEEISRRTNLSILKGDYLFSLGYSNVTSIGNDKVLKYYIKISEMFSKSFFTKSDSSQKALSNENKFISFIYLGCLGINELLNKSNNETNEMMKLMLNYGILVYMKEEISRLKNKNQEYISDEGIQFFFNLTKNVFNYLTDGAGKTIEDITKKLNKVILYKNDQEKLKNITVNICFEILILVDKISQSEQESSKFKNYTMIDNDGEIKHLIKNITVDYLQLISPRLFEGK